MTKITAAWPLLGLLLVPALVSSPSQAAFWFTNNKQSEGADGKQSSLADGPGRPEAAKQKSPDQAKPATVGSGGGGETPRIPQRIDLSVIRATKGEQASLARGLAADKLTQVTGELERSSAGRLQGGRTRRNQLRSEKKPINLYLDEAGADEDEDGPARLDLDEDDDQVEAEAAAKTGQSAGRPAAPANKVKYVTTKGRELDPAARQKLLGRINYQRVSRDDAPAGPKKSSGSSLTSKKFWNKKFNGALKATNNGLKATMKGLAELPKDLSNALDSVSAYLQLDGRGRILSMIQEVEAAAKFVRKEFSKFTLDWSPLMEQALDFLGDAKLDKVTWNDSDELDLRRDALHSLVFGFEFMRLMVIWRENLLLVHEAFRFWLEGLKQDYEREPLNLERDLRHPPAEVHNYMMLMAWDTIWRDSLEPRLNLDKLIEVEDMWPKNYESKFFRNIVFLQELYLPTLRELSRERESVNRVTEDQDETATFFLEFRDMVARDEVEGVDVLVPGELSDFMARLRGQLHNTRLVYDKSHLKAVRLELERANREREALLEELNQRLEGGSDEESSA